MRFELLYEPEPNTGCFLWTGNTVYGYGLFPTKRADGVWWGARAHRVAWTLEYGDPGKAHVLHRCDVRPCVNVRHMFLGDQRINMADMNAKQRHCRGEAVPQAKLTEEDVREIRAAIARGEAQVSIAKRFGIDQSNVSQIKRGFSWKWLS
jgi:HNH endonuclease